MSVPASSIVCMFDTAHRVAGTVPVDSGGWPEDLVDLPTVDLGRLVEQNAIELRAREARQLVLAAAWADAHDPPVGSLFGPRVERARCFGGDGTPEVAEFCVAEFAALQGLSFSSGRAMIADALDLRHRLPMLWTQVRAGQVRAWKGQKVAQATRPLAADAAAEVDAAIAGYIETLPWPRFEKILRRRRSSTPTPNWRRSGPSGPARNVGCGPQTPTTG